MTQDLNEATDRELLEIAQDPEQHSRKERHAAYDEFCGRHWGYLRSRIRRRWGIPEHRAGELSQKTFMRLWRHLHKYEPGTSKPTTYLTHIAENLCKNRLRNRGREATQPISELERRAGQNDDGNDRGFLETIEDPDADPVNMAHRAELRELIEDAIESLERPDRRAVCRLRILENRSYKAIADETGVVLGTVKSMLHRSRAELRERIRDRLQDRPELLPDALSHIAPEARAA